MSTSYPPISLIFLSYIKQNSSSLRSSLFCSGISYLSLPLLLLLRSRFEGSACVIHFISVEGKIIPTTSYISRLRKKK